MKTYFAIYQHCLNTGSTGKQYDNTVYSTPAEALVLDFLLTLISSSVLTPRF